MRHADVIGGSLDGAEGLRWIYNGVSHMGHADVNGGSLDGPGGLRWIYNGVSHMRHPDANRGRWRVDYYMGSIAVVVMKRPPLRLGDLQLRILEILWGRKGASVAEVHEVLKPERDLAYTTVATMLRKMEARELVQHREDGRAFLYRAKVEAEEVNRSAGEHFVGRLFEGSLADAVSHLLTTREVSRAELDELEKMIREAKRRAR
jgi:predicted transcriptional regulator